MLCRFNVKFLGRYKGETYPRESMIEWPKDLPVGNDRRWKGERYKDLYRILRFTSIDLTTRDKFLRGDDDNPATSRSAVVVKSRITPAISIIREI